MKMGFAEDSRIRELWTGLWKLKFTLLAFVLSLKEVGPKSIFIEQAMLHQFLTIL